MEQKRLYRTEGNEKMLCGVCGGIAEYFNIDPSIVRILAVLLSIGSIGTGAIVYCVAALLIPKE